MKKLSVLFFAVLLINTCFSQQLAPTVIASAGKDLVAGEYRLSFTVGELAVTTLRSGSFILTQGFQQPPNLYLSDITNHLPDNLTINAYPNPTTDFVHVNLTGEGEFSNINILVYNNLGQIVNIKFETIPNTSGITFIIDLTSLSRGNYFVRIYSPEKSASLAEFKVIKIN
ncbi:MAG: T9SS type A sorting domain-containing protein [Sphingobacteriales bacterium]|nr:T9SS type A sorting domain-containing protein [Sphingobacteriales bacterium]